MKKTLAAITLSSCLFFACSNSNDSAKVESSTPSEPSVQNAAPVTSDPAPSVTAPAPTVIAPAPAPTTQAATADASGMNPAHGQPGHRCDIPVGAPLNSPPSTGGPQTNPVNAPPPGSSTQITPTSAPGMTPASAPVVTAPGMNPPHGEPGHDCAIPVGAPLKKK